MAGNLTYLGNPYQQGQGTATVMPAGDVGTAFMQSMQDLKTQRRKEQEAEDKKKAEAVKSVDEYAIDYHLGHQSYFSKELQALKDKAITLKVQGADFSNPGANKEVEELLRKQAKLKIEAQNSKALGQYFDIVLNLKPTELEKISSKSKDELKAFMAMPFEQQLKAWETGGYPKITPKQDVPDKEIDAVVIGFKNKIPFSAYNDRAVLDKYYEDSKTQLTSWLNQSLTDQMFEERAYETGRPAADLRKEYIKGKVDALPYILYDDKTAAQVAAAKERNKIAASRKSGSGSGTPSVESGVRTMIKEIASGNRNVLTTVSRMLGTIVDGVQTNATISIVPIKSSGMIDKNINRKLAYGAKGDVQYLKIDIPGNDNPHYILYKDANGVVDTFEKEMYDRFGTAMQEDLKKGAFSYDPAQAGQTPKAGTSQGQPSNTGSGGFIFPTGKQKF